MGRIEATGNRQLMNTGLCRTRQIGLIEDFSQSAVGAVSASTARSGKFSI